MNVHVNGAALPARHLTKRNGTAAIRRESPTKAKNSRFDRLVARYYPAVYSFALRLTDDPWEAVVLTRDAFNSTRKQLRYCRDEVVLVTILLTAVIRAGLTAA
jgi:DNA-directed RNA polymerase specialized sigma24 family protein